MRALCGLLLALTLSWEGIAQEVPRASLDVHPRDRAVAAAHADARVTLDHFFARWEAETGSASHYQLNVSFPYGTNGTEHVWVGYLQRLEPAKFAGTVLAEPENTTAVQEGERIEFTLDRVSDWAYFKDGKLHGAYTTRALLDRYPADVAEQMRAILAPLP